MNVDYDIQNYETTQQQSRVNSKIKQQSVGDDLAYQYYQGYSPYSYSVAGKPYISLFDSSSDQSCSLKSSFQRQFLNNGECIQASERSANNDGTDFSLTVECMSTSPFSIWTAVMYDSTNCNSPPITRVVGDGPCSCLPFTINDQSYNIKVNCAGIIFFPCNAYSDDAYYYGAASSISVYSRIYDNQQCLAPTTNMETKIGHSNRTVTSTNGLNVQNSHCIMGTFPNNQSLGFSVQCKEPTTSSKWSVNVFDNCTEQATNSQPLNILKGSDPCQCIDGETNGIAYSVSINCAGSTSYTCVKQQQESFMHAEHLAGIVIASVVILSILLAMLYPLISSFSLSGRELINSDDEKRDILSDYSMNGANSRDSDTVMESRDSEKTIVVNPISAGNQTVPSMDILAKLYENSQNKNDELYYSA